MLWGIPLSTATPLALLLGIVALNITGFLRGWIVPRNLVMDLVARADQRASDYRELYESEKERADIMEDVLANTVTIGETAVRILKALPASDDDREKSRT